MFCPKCGSQIPDNAMFCGNCGAKVVSDAPKVQNTQPAPQQEIYQPAEETTVLEGIQNVRVDFGDQVPVKIKKKLPKKFFVIPVAIVALVAVVVSFAFVPVLRRFWEDSIARPVSGTVIKTVGSDEDYLKFVEKEAFNGYGGYINTATNFYGTLMDTTTDDTYVEASVSLNASEDALEILEENFAECDLSFINETVLKIAGGQNGDLFQLNGELEVNGKSVLDPSVLINMDKEEAFISILCLNNKYIRTELEVAGDVADALSESMIQNEEFRKAIPSDEELNDLLSKYIKVALDELDGVSVDKEELEIGDIEEKLTTVELEFTEEVAMNMVKAVLEEAKKDKKLKSYINDVAKILEDEDMIDDAEEAYEAFVDGIDEVLDEIEDTDASDEAVFVLVDYVDSSHKIVGRALYEGDDTDAEPIFFYGTVHDGKDYAFEFCVPSAEILVTGEGVDKGGVLTGEYIVSVMDNDFVKISLEKFDTNGISDGKIKGKVTVAPSGDLLGEMGANGIEYFGISIADLALQLDLDVAEKKADITVNVLVDKEFFAGVTVAYKIGSAPNFKIPAAKNVVDIDDVEEWIEEIDLDKFVKNLEKAELPDEIIEFVEEMIGELESAEDMFAGFGDLEAAIPNGPVFNEDYEVSIDTAPYDEDYDDYYYYE